MLSTNMAIAVHKPSPLAWLIQQRFWLLCAVLFIVIALISLNSGNMNVDWQHVRGAMYARLQGELLSSSEKLASYIVFELRIPRIVMASCVGLLLGVAGCTMQAVVRNPLADPGLIGISGGAAAAAAATIIFLPQITPLTLVPSSMLLTMSGFAGALIAVWAVVSIASNQHGIQLASLILAGVAINALATTLIGLSSYVASDDALRQITYWTLGSLGGSNWSTASAVMVGSLLCSLCLLRLRTALNLLALGETEAVAMGLNVKRYRSIALWIVALGVALATSLCGIIAFVGLIVPHITRRIVGADHRWLLPASAAVGAILVLFADMVSRSIVPPLEIPIGIVTSAIGAPYLLFLLRVQSGKPHA